MKKKICIYGAGKYGLHTYLKMKRAGIIIDFFADRNKKKTGYAIDGKYCISYDELMTLDKNDVVLIMGVNDHLSLIQHFKNEGFCDVYRADDYIKLNGNYSDIKIYAPIKEKEYLINIKQILVDAVYKQKFNQNEISVDCDLNGIIKDYQIRNKHNEDIRS